MRARIAVGKKARTFNFPNLEHLRSCASDLTCVRGAQRSLKAARQRALDPANPTDGPLDAGHDGYPNVEAYLRLFLPSPPGAPENPCTPLEGGRMPVARLLACRSRGILTRPIGREESAATPTETVRQTPGNTFSVLILSLPTRAWYYFSSLGRRLPGGATIALGQSRRAGIADRRRRRCRGSLRRRW